MRSFRVSQLLACVFTVCLGGVSAHANPIDGVVSDGQATIATNGTTLNINQSSERAVIDWRSFNIDPNETTAFHQPSSSSLTLNRINSADPSQILGTLTANGHVILINPNGIFFGKGSHVDVGGLTATTANIRNSDFMSGHMNFDRPGRNDASIINEGSITVHDGGLVNLVGPNVENRGVITATLGKINMASGEKFTIDMANDGLIKVAVDKNSLPGRVIANTGTLSANGGQVNMTAAAARDIVDSLITNTGVIEAKTIGSHQGSVTLSAEGNNAVAHNLTANKNIKQGQSAVVNSGTIDVSGLDAGESGGSASLLADNVRVESGSTISASGANGGGTVKIGGDFHGEGDTPTASVTYVASNTSITADAIDQGDGGDVTIWADGSTNFYGDISAKGGANSGNGGFVEVSGKDYLNYRGRVNTLAESGETGMLLLDPADIVIMNGSGDGDLNGSATSFAGAATNGTVSAGNANPSTIYESELEGIGATTAISVAASNSITINSLSDGNLNLQQIGGKSVAFSAGIGGITMLNTANTITTAGGALSLSTTGGTATLGNLTTGGGNLTVGSTGAGVATIGNISTGNGTVSITETGGGSIGNINSGTSIALNLGAATTISGVISGAASMTKTGAGTLTLNGINTYSGGTSLNVGTIIAGNDSAFGTGILTLKGATLQGSAARTFANAVSLAAGSSFSGTSDLTFTGDALGTTNITLTNNGTGLVSFGNVGISSTTGPRALSFAGTGNFLVSGIISNNASTGAIGMSGTGTLTLTGANTYTNGTTVTSGTLLIGNDGALGTGTLTIGGGTIQGSGGVHTVGNAVMLNTGSTISGAQDLTFNGAVSLNADTTFSGSASLTFNGTMTNVHISNSFTLTNNNSGTLTFGNVVLSNNATNRTLTIAGTGTTVLSGTVSNGAASSGSALTKTGTGMLLLSGNNSYAGTTKITGGTIQIGSNTALGSGVISLNGGTLQSNGDYTLANVISLSDNSTIAGSSNLIFTGTMTNIGDLTLTNNSTGAVTFSGAYSLSNNATSRVFTVAGSGNTTFSGAIGNGSTAPGSGITMAGSGVLTLSNANTYAGTTRISSGTLKVGNDAALGTGTLSLNGGTIQSDGVHTLANIIALQNNSTIAGSSALSFTGTLGNTSDLTLTNNNTATTTFGAVTLSTHSLTLAGAGNTTITGAITSPSGTLIKQGAGTLALNGNNSYSGGTTISAGTVQIGSNTALGSGNVSLAGGTVQGDGAIRTLSNALTLSASSTVAGSSALTFNGAMTNTGDFILTNNNSGGTSLGNIALSDSVTNRTLTISGTGNTAIAGVIGNGSSIGSNLKKSGAGTLTLSGNNTYTGTTTVSSGTLKLGASDRISNLSDVSVSSGATLDFSGFNETVHSIVAAGDVAFGTGNTLTTADVQTYTGKITGGNVSLVSTGSNITATNVLNDITGDLALNAAGSVSIVDANALKLGSVSANTLSVFAKGGNLTLDGNIQTTGTSGTPLLLSTSGNFINSGSYTLQTGAGGRWLVYSTSPLSNSNGGLAAAFKQYNATYGDTVLGSGNGFIYTLAPVVTAGLSGPVAKTYDGTVAATLGAGNYTITNAIDGDTVTLNNPVSGTYDTANAGTGKTVTVSGLSLSGVTNGAATVYGYQLDSSTASTAVGTVGSANLRVTTSDVTKVYDGTVAAIGAPVIVSGTLYANASNGNAVDSLSGGSYAYVTPDFGTGKTVLVGSVTVNDGNGGNNYHITYSNNTTSSITPSAEQIKAMAAPPVNDVIASVTYARSPFILPQADRITARNAVVLNTEVEIAPVTTVFEVQPSLGYDHMLISSAYVSLCEECR